jgi:hypothetical protein
MTGLSCASQSGSSRSRKLRSSMALRLPWRKTAYAGRGGGGCDRVHCLAARPLDQRPKYPGGWSGAAARAARPPALLGLATLRFGTITGNGASLLRRPERIGVQALAKALVSGNCRLDQLPSGHPLLTQIACDLRRIRLCRAGLRRHRSGRLHRASWHPRPRWVRIGIGDPFLWRDCDPGIAETANEAVNALARADAVTREFTLPEAEATPRSVRI